MPEAHRTTDYTARGDLPPALLPAKALSWSEARVNDEPGDKPAIALWRPDGTTVALGLSQQPEVEADIQALRRDGVDLVRRQSGGGAVLLYPGVLCWEAWAAIDTMEADKPGASGIRDSYRFLCLPIKNALSSLGLDIFQAGISDLSVRRKSGAARKLAGTAQLRRSRQILVHGSLLVDADITLLGTYLKFPSAQPDYRNGRSHRDFCATVRQELGSPTPFESCMVTVVEAIHREAVREGWELAAPPATLDAAAQSLYDAKYAVDAWNWEKKRTP